MARTYPTVLDLVGATPIVRLDALSPAGGPELLAKLEYLNPGGSVKDRIGMAMIEAAEHEGKLKPGGTIVEPTSGNTGVGLAMVGAVKGYKVVLVMPDSMSVERRRLMLAYGATFVLTPREKGMNGSIAKAQEIVASTPGALTIPGTATTSSPRTTSGHCSRSERGIFASTNTS